MYLYMYMYIHAYIYIYIERERDRAGCIRKTREDEWLLELGEVFARDALDVLGGEELSLRPNQNKGLHRGVYL